MHVEYLAFGQVNHRHGRDDGPPWQIAYRKGSASSSDDRGGRCGPDMIQTRAGGFQLLDTPHTIILVRHCLPSHGFHVFQIIRQCHGHARLRPRPQHSLHGRIQVFGARFVVQFGSCLDNDTPELSEQRIGRCEIVDKGNGSNRRRPTPFKIRVAVIDKDFGALGNRLRCDTLAVMKGSVAIFVGVRVR